MTVVWPGRVIARCHRRRDAKRTGFAALRPLPRQPTPIEFGRHPRGTPRQVALTPAGQSRDARGALFSAARNVSEEAGNVNPHHSVLAWGLLLAAQARESNAGRPVSACIVRVDI